MILWVTLALIPRLILGLFLVAWLFPNQAAGRLLRLVLAGPLGIGASSLLGFLWIVAGLDLHLYVILEAVGVVVAVIVVCWRRRARLRELVRSFRVPVWRGPPLPMMLLGAAILLTTASFALTAQLKPHGGWDAWNNWNVVARFIHRGGPDWQRTFLRQWDQPGYPFLLPIANASTWALLGTESTRGPMMLGLFFTAMLASVLFAVVRELRGTQQAALATLALLAVSGLIRNGAEQLADVPLAVYFLISAGMLPLYRRTPHRSFILIAGLAAGLAAWTKDEGIPFAAIASLPWLIVDRSQSWPLLRKFVLGASAPLLIVAAFKIVLAPPSYLFMGLADRVAYLDARNLVGVLSLVARDLLTADWTVPACLVALLVYAVSVGRSKAGGAAILPVLVVIILQAIAYVLIYFITPFDEVWHIETSVGRLYLHLFPLMLLCIFAWLRTPDQLAQSHG